MEGPRFSSSAFSPAAARKTSMCLLRNRETGDHRLVTSISTRKSTEVLRINLRTGRLELENDEVAESSYANEGEALTQLQVRGFELAERGSALLGYAVAGPAAGVLLATRSKEKAVLPGGHTVYAVTDSQWTIVPLLNEAADAVQAAALAGLPLPKGDIDFWRALQQFTLNNAHYYCETADISRPFPSDKDPREPSPEFVWNSWMRQPLVELGLYDHCPALLQGAVECSTLQHPCGGARFSMCLVSRRSRRHPGTRYIARGLNTLAGPGNEIECELLTWTHPEQQHYGSSSFTAGSAGGSTGAQGGSEALKWARVVWRRGTVPIWWGVQLQSLAQGLQAEVYVREEHPYEGTASYFRNVQRQHVPRPGLLQPLLAAAGASSGGSAAAAGGTSRAGGGGRGCNEGWTLVDDGAAANGSAAAAAAGAAAGLPEQQQQQAHVQQGGTASTENLGLMVPVTCINLLHANPKKASELMLSSHFQDAMRHVRRRLGGQAPIKVVNFDWHGNMGRLSEEKAVEGFWSLMEPFVKQTGFAAGWMEAAADGVPPAPLPASFGTTGTHTLSAAGTAAGGDGTVSMAELGAGAGVALATAWPPGWCMRWSRQQAGLLRFNCADSLDRTNAATCFAMLPVLQEQLRVLGLALECAVPPATVALLRSRGRSSAGDVAALVGQPPQAPQGPAIEDVAACLPEGWEVRQHEGRLLFIDHLNQQTQWTPPSPVPPRMPPPTTGASPVTGQPPSAGRPSSGAPLSARMMQSASDMLARLQRQSASPGTSSGSSGGGGGIGGAPRSTPLLSLERRSSPPSTAGSDGGSGSGQYWARNGSSGSLNSGGVHHAASAPDVNLTSSCTSTATISEVPERDPHRPWAFFDYDIGDVRDCLLKDAVDGYVDMFRIHGDIHSFLYTGSPAMHSHVLNLVTQGGKAYGATSGVGKLQNLRVAVQRRWNNTVSDASRQQAMELFLGLRIHDGGDQKGYFPGLQVVYRDSTQALLGGMEPFELAPLPPAPPTHSRQPSASAPLFTSVVAAEPAAPASQQEEEQRQQQQQLGRDLEEQEEVVVGENDDRAHAVAGVSAVHHAGVLGVRQSLLDLEPLTDLPNRRLPLTDPEQRHLLHGGEPPTHHSSSRLGHGRGRGSECPAAKLSQPGSSEGSAPAPVPGTSAVGPLGTTRHGQGGPASTQQQQFGELIDLGADSSGDATPDPQGTAPASTVHAQLDLLL